MRLNTELLLKIKQAILDEPKGFQMVSFEQKPSALKSRCMDYGLSWEFPICGTSLCIAGHALALSGFPDYAEYELLQKARELLGIEYKDVSYTLFYVEDWPKDLKDRFYAAKTPEERALIGAERIDRFLTE